ncbi:MAG TPA: hypothetical protein VH419_06760 [Nocardioidaceae bacterium]
MFAPARKYILELLKHVLANDISPGLAIGLTPEFDAVSEAYAAMDEQKAIMSPLRVSQRDLWKRCPPSSTLLDPPDQSTLLTGVSWLTSVSLSPCMAGAARSH